MLLEKKIEKSDFIKTCSCAIGENPGFLPGDMKEKVDPYLDLYMALYELFGAEKIAKKIESGEIEIKPISLYERENFKELFCYS